MISHMEQLIPWMLGLFYLTLLQKISNVIKYNKSQTAKFNTPTYKAYSSHSSSHLLRCGKEHFPNFISQRCLILYSSKHLWVWESHLFFSSSDMFKRNLPSWLALKDVQKILPGHGHVQYSYCYLTYPYHLSWVYFCMPTDIPA